MRLIIIYLSFILFNVPICFSQQKENVITLDMMPSDKFVLCKSDGISSMSTLDFYNYRSTPEKIIRKFLSSKPSHLYYSEVFNEKNGNSKRTYGSVLILPGDSINLVKQADNFLDDFMDITTSNYTGAYKQWIKEIKEIGVSKILDTIERRYRTNLSSIKLSKIDEKKKSILLDFNYLLKNSEISNIPFELLAESDLKKMDSLQKDILKNIDKIYNINSLLNYRIYYHLIQYSAFRIGNREVGFWNFFNKTNNEVKQSIFFKPYLFTQMDVTNKSNPDNLTTAIKKMKEAKIDEKLIDSYYNKIMSYNNSSKLGSLSATELSAIILTNTNEMKMSLKDVLNKSMGKIIMIDFWASWCVPCRSEFPKYEEIKIKYVNEKISFISISIDLDNAIPKWKNALTEEKVKDPQNHYRLINPKASILTKKIALRTIPRYVIIDFTGNIIDGDAIRPSNPEVFSRLNTIIKNYKTKSP